MPGLPFLKPFVAGSDSNQDLGHRVKLGLTQNQSRNIYKQAGAELPSAQKGFYFTEIIFPGL